MVGSARSSADGSEVLARAAAGDIDAARQLLDEVGEILFGFVYARVGGDLAVAEDLTQETLLEACRSAPTFRGESSLSTWMCAIARRRVARHYERERRHELASAGLQLVSEEHGESPTLDVDDRDEIVRALGRLPVAQRQVLVLKYLDGLSVAEIGSEMDRSPVQVQSLLQRARDGLRRHLGEQS